MELNRKEFLKLSGSGIFTFLAGGALLPQGGSGNILARAKGELAILYDYSKCIGCRACQMACKRWNAAK